MYILSTALLFAGAGVGLAALIMEVALLLTTGKKASALLGIAVAGGYSGIMIAALVRQGSGLACSMLSPGALVAAALLLALHLWFLWDGFRQLKTHDREVRENDR